MADGSHYGDARFAALATLGPPGEIDRVAREFVNVAERVSRTADQVYLAAVSGNHSLARKQEHIDAALTALESHERLL
jgi:hypothetical protein